MKNLLRKLTKFYALAFSDKMQLMKIWCILSVILCLLTILPFVIFLKTYRYSLTLPHIFSDPNFNSEQELAELTTKAANGFPFIVKCLPIALAYKWLLRTDKAAILKIGVQRNKDFEFHAWVEAPDRILINAREKDAFSVLWQII